MCIVIDTNLFGDVFNTSSCNHENFKAVFLWIIEGKGKIVYGGSKYLAELAKARKYLGLFAELKKENKIVKLDDKKVDGHQKKGFIRRKVEKRVER